MYLIKLRKQINAKKDGLFRLYREQGVTNEVLRLSKELDEMIYEYQLLNFPFYVDHENLLSEA